MKPLCNLLMTFLLGAGFVTSTGCQTVPSYDSEQNVGLQDVSSLNAPLTGEGLESPEQYLSLIQDTDALTVEWDNDKRDDLEWRALYYAQQRYYRIRQIKLIGDLARAFPETRELKSLLLTRFEYATYIQGIDMRGEVEAYERSYQSSKADVATAWYWYANTTIRMNYRKEAPIMAAIAEFEERYPRDERVLTLYQTGISYLRDLPGEKKLRDMVVEKYPDSSAAQNARRVATLEAAVGKVFDVTFLDQLTGREVSTRNLRGKVVVIDFWATWCGPCIAELPRMKQLYDQYKSAGVEFVGISLDSDPAVLKKFCKENDITWPQYCESGKAWDTELSSSWGISSIPTIFILDKSGRVHTPFARGKLDSLIPELLRS